MSLKTKVSEVSIEVSQDIMFVSPPLCLCLVQPVVSQRDWNELQKRPWKSGTVEVTRSKTVELSLIIQETRIMKVLIRLPSAHIFAANFALLR